MTPDAKTLSTSFFARQDELRGGPDADLCGPSYTAHLPGGPPMGLEEHGQFAQAFYRAFPDLAHRVEEVLAENSRVSVRFRLTGTHAGEFMGLPPTGNRIDLEAMAVLGVAEGRVHELHGCFDRLSLMEQLGAVASG